MLELEYTSKFKKDYKKLKKQGKDLALLEKALRLLRAGCALPEEWRDHALIGDYKQHRELHIQPDWLLIYRIDDNRLVLTAVRTGSHSELFDL